MNSCSNSDTWVERELTQCADDDIATYTIDTTREGELLEIKRTIEDSLKIDIIEIKEEFRSTLEESCRACSCKTGFVISLKIDEAHVEALSAFRFY